MEPVKRNNTTDFLKEIFYASLTAVDPYKKVREHAGRISHEYRHGGYRRFAVTGIGKASCLMGKAIEDTLGDLSPAGILITKYGHCGPSCRLKKMRVYEAGHPIPDENGLNATEKIIRLLRESDEKTMILCLISGGGSALLVSPYQGISLEDKKTVTRLLLEAGADIFELNTVRKHISKVKGGRLAEAAYPAKVISLILSDVIGDKLDVIASGPTCPDSGYYMDALGILEKYNLIELTPATVLDVIRRGDKNMIPETPKEGDKIFERVDNIIIGSNRVALAAAKKKAEELGFRAEIISSEITGEARKVGIMLAEKALKIKNEKVEQIPLCLISGGETTVKVRGNGLGGRNMELALSFAMAIEGSNGITLLSAATDGTDGPTDAAGAIVDGNTVSKAISRGVDPPKYLENNDTYNFFRRIDEVLFTGPTGTNVMDIQIILIR
ncbi:MAG: glycerate kinase [Nitrospirota bacterium]